MGVEGQLNVFTQLVVTIILAAPRCIHWEFVERWRLTAWQGAPVKEFTKRTLDKGGRDLEYHTVVGEYVTGKFFIVLLH